MSNRLCRGRLGEEGCHQSGWDYDMREMRLAHVVSEGRGLIVKLVGGETENE